MIEYDSIAEHLTVLIYWGKYIRSFFYNLFINHAFILPQWDFSIGLGADILTTLHWYAIGEPLNLLAAFFKPEKTRITVLKRGDFKQGSDMKPQIKTRVAPLRKIHNTGAKVIRTLARRK